MLAVAWPSWRCTALMLAPWRIISDAAVCRRSYSRKSPGNGSGRPEVVPDFVELEVAVPA